MCCVIYTIYNIQSACYICNSSFETCQQISILTPMPTDKAHVPCRHTAVPETLHQMTTVCKQRHDRLLPVGTQGGKTRLRIKRHRYATKQNNHPSTSPSSPQRRKRLHASTDSPTSVPIPTPAPAFALAVNKSTIPPMLHALWLVSTTCCTRLKN